MNQLTTKTSYFVVSIITISLILSFAVLLRVMDFASARESLTSLSQNPVTQDTVELKGDDELQTSFLSIESEPLTSTVPGDEVMSPNVSQLDPISYWIYPGPPACDTYDELEELGTVYEVKPEFATVTEEGNIEILIEPEAGCNALSRTNVNYYKSISGSQFITVSGSGLGFSNLMTDISKQNQSITTLIALVEQTDFDGIELDFEGYSSWTQEDYDGYLSYLNLLGTQLRAIGKELMIDAPAIYNDGIQSVFKFTYADLKDLPVDWITMMAYDYQYDFGGGAPVTEDQFLIDSITRAVDELEGSERLVIGLPTYGYTAIRDDYAIRILTYDQVLEIVGEEAMANAQRLDNSQEMLVEFEGQVYVFQDQISIDHKISIVREQGIERIAIWHLGGNPLVNVE